MFGYKTKDREIISQRDLKRIMNPEHLPSWVFREAFESYRPWGFNAREIRTVEDFKHSVQCGNIVILERFGEEALNGLYDRDGNLKDDIPIFLRNIERDAHKPIPVYSVVEEARKKLPKDAPMKSWQEYEAEQKALGNPVPVREPIKRDDLKPIEPSKKVFKQHHQDGSQAGMWPDSYTLMSDGKPMGAEEGPMPEEFQGLDEPPEDMDQRIAEGYPDIATGKDYENLTDIEPIEFTEDTKLYRVIDEGTQEITKNSSGLYWSFSLPESKTEWRRNYAVKDSWNDNGHYIEHVFPMGTKVWIGGGAGQQYKKHNGKSFYLKGGKEHKQIIVEKSALTGEQIKPKRTNWSDAI